MKSYRDEAVEILSHYLKTAYEKSGLEWSDDNDREVGKLVDYLIAAAKP